MATPVKAGQKGIAYHFSVIDTRGMWHDAFDLMDAYTIADQWAKHYCAGSRIVDSAGNVVAYQHYLHMH